MEAVEQGPVFGGDGVEVVTHGVVHRPIMRGQENQLSGVVDRNPGCVRPGRLGSVAMARQIGLRAAFDRAPEANSDWVSRPGLGCGSGAFWVPGPPPLLVSWV